VEANALAAVSGDEPGCEAGDIAFGVRLDLEDPHYVDGMGEDRRVPTCRSPCGRNSHVAWLFAIPVPGRSRKQPGTVSVQHILGRKGERRREVPRPRGCGVDQ
jgi:hypothetical protein